MKKIIGILGLFTLLIGFNKAALPSNASNYSSLTKTINLNAVSETDIREYYADLNSLSSEERTSTNLLKNLKPILRENFEYISYANVWKAYEITDRDWALSPASETKYGTFDSSKNIITDYEYGTSSSDSKNNPYIHAYYRDHTSTDTSIQEDAKIKAWDDHSATGLNREHVWPQSHGFKADSGAEGPAGTDLHHLVAADGQVNSSIHNNLPYGYAKDASSTGNRVSTSSNKVGTPKTTSSNDQGDKVFEPQDQDKGDIARACFYMIAMYNNLANESGVISKFDPNLELVSFVIEDRESTGSSDTYTVTYGNLTDLLEWNKLDPVDEYEMHRNDLIYRNYQHNRNPFIDFPTWADIIWGSDKGVKSADPTKDEISKSNAYIAPTDSNSDTGSINLFNVEIPTYVLIIAIIAIVVIIIIAIIIFASKSKKEQKKILKKVAKKVTKQSSSKSTKKSSSKKKK